MNLAQLTAAVSAQKCAGWRYQQSGRHPFRDRITVYADGKILFERFCYGEAAGKVFIMWGSGADENGALQWDYESCPNSHKTEAPKQLTDAAETALILDGKADAWTRTECLKTDPENGYTLFKKLFRK